MLLIVGHKEKNKYPFICYDTTVAVLFVAMIQHFRRLISIIIFTVNKAFNVFLEKNCKYVISQRIPKALSMYIRFNLGRRIRPFIN